MKKVLFSIAIVAVVVTMVSCGGKTAKGGDNDSTALADSAVTVAPAELWTVEAVEAQIRKMYDRLNDMDKNGVINIVTLEDEFCSSSYLNLRNTIHKAIKDATGDDRMFFGDEEGYRFLAGMSTPLEIESIKTDLLTGNMAQAQVRFKGADEEKGFMRLELDLEDGMWRVKNFDQPEAFGDGGILKLMLDFALEHGIRNFNLETSAEGATKPEEWDISVRLYDEVMYEGIIRDANGNNIMMIGGNTVDNPKDMLETFGNVWQADVDFDGHTDIMICLGKMHANDQTVTYYDAWLYNPETGKFDSHHGFRDISNPEVDIANKYVKGHYLLRDGKTKQYFAYTIEKDGTTKKLKEWQEK